MAVLKTPATLVRDGRDRMLNDYEHSRFGAYGMAMRPRPDVIQHHQRAVAWIRPPQSDEWDEERGEQ